MWILIALIILVLIAIALICIVVSRRKKGIKNIVNIAGFAYDPQQDIFYSEMNAWQRKFGYCHLYDEVSPTIGLIYECEPIQFEYDDQKWLIEIWKGQYGMTMGCELGVYTSSFPSIDMEGIFNGNFYDQTKDENHLDMTISLIKDDKMVFYRSDRHWWLTGFVLGDFTQPEELKMQIKIVMKSIEMRDAFINAMVLLGYSEDSIIKEDKTVYFIFDKPYAKQPAAMNTEIRNIWQSSNKMYCDWYQNLTAGLENTVDKVSYVKEHAPELNHKINESNRNKNIYKNYGQLKKYLSKRNLRKYGSTDK